MGHHTEAFVGIDTSKSCNAIAIADGGRGGAQEAAGADSPNSKLTELVLQRRCFKHVTAASVVGQPALNSIATHRHRVVTRPRGEEAMISWLSFRKRASATRTAAYPRSAT